MNSYLMRQRRVVATVVSVFSFVVLATGGSPASAQSYETIRFYTKQSRPERLLSHAFSPDGKWLALSFTSGVGARSGVSLVDLAKMELVRSSGSYSLFTLAFSSDSQKLIGMSDYVGLEVFDVATGAFRRPDGGGIVPGVIGLRVEEKNGKLLITQVTGGSNPTLGDQVREGDELLAVNEGEAGRLRNDSREWRPLMGKPLKQALEALAGPPGTWVQLRLARRGVGSPVEASVQRRWPAGSAPVLPSSGLSMATGLVGERQQFVSADTASECAYLTLRDIDVEGPSAVSPDGKWLAALGKVNDARPWCVEVHSLAEGTVVASTEFRPSNWRGMRYAADSRRVLVGTRDTVEIYDVEEDRWLPPVVLTPPEEADEGRVVDRRVPLGFGFPGDLYTTVREVVYAQPAALRKFDVSPGGLVAVGSETGDLVLASLESRERVGVLGENLLGASPEMVGFNPQGNRLAAFAGGVLHLFEVSAEGDVAEADASSKP